MIWVELRVAETSSVCLFCSFFFFKKKLKACQRYLKNDIFQVRAEVWTKLPTQLSRFEVKHMAELFVEGSWAFSLWFFQPSSWGSLRLGWPDSEEVWKNEDWVSTLPLCRKLASWDQQLGRKINFLSMYPLRQNSVCRLEKLCDWLTGQTREPTWDNDFSPFKFFDFPKNY